MGVFHWLLCGENPWYGQSNAFGMEANANFQNIFHNINVLYQYRNRLQCHLLLHCGGQMFDHIVLDIQIYNTNKQISVLMSKFGGKYLVTGNTGGGLQTEELSLGESLQTEERVLR